MSPARLERPWVFANEEKRDFLPRSLPMSHKLELDIYLNWPGQICPWKFTLIKDLKVICITLSCCRGRWKAWTRTTTVAVRMESLGERGLFIYVYTNKVAVVYVLGQSPCGRRKTMHGNSVLIILNTQHICHHAWKTVRISFRFLNILQSQWEGPKK